MENPLFAANYNKSTNSAAFFKKFGIASPLQLQMIFKRIKS
jgi:hypothetical protein